MEVTRPQPMHSFPQQAFERFAVRLLIPDRLETVGLYRGLLLFVRVLFGEISVNINQYFPRTVTIGVHSCCDVQPL